MLTRITGLLSPADLAAIGADLPEASAAALIGEALMRHAEVQDLVYPRRIGRPRISRYAPGQVPQPEVTDGLVGTPPALRADLLAAVLLGPPGAHEGATLRIDSPFGPQEVPLAAGDAAIFPASAGHRMAPVGPSEQVAAWVVIESHVRDPVHRELLTDIRRLRDRLALLEPDGEAAIQARRTHANLLRMWADP